MSYPGAIMTNDDILANGDHERKAIRDRLIDAYLATLGDEDVEAIRETVAIEHARRWPPAGAIVRRADPRSSPAVRARIFAMMPADFDGRTGTPDAARQIDPPASEASGPTPGTPDAPELQPRAVARIASGWRVAGQGIAVGLVVR